MISPMNKRIAKIMIAIAIAMIFAMGIVNGTGSIKNVQKGGFTMSGTSQDITIDAVNTSASVLFFGYSTNNNGPSQFLIRGHLSSSTNIHFERVGSSSAEVVWYVAEFDSGVDVQSGIIAQGATTTTGLNTFNQSSTFPLISFENLGSTLGTDDYARARIISSTQLETAATGSLGDTLAYFVVDYEGAIVQEELATLTGTTVTDNFANPVNLNKSFVIGTSNVNSNMGADDGSFIVNFTSTSQVGFERGASGGQHNIAYHVIEFTGKERVYTGFGNMDSSTTEVDVTLPRNINLSRSVAFMTGNQKGGFTSETDDNMGTVYFTSNLSDSRNLKVRRATTGGDAASFQWTVIEFAGPNRAPEISGVTITSTDGLNTNASDLFGNATLTDKDGDRMNVSVKWFNGSNLAYETDYNNSYANNSQFSALLNFTNTSIGETWIFSIRTFDGDNFSSWVNSSGLLIVDSNGPIPVIVSPTNTTLNSVQTNLNYTITSGNPLSQCWYTINGGVTNTTIVCGNNVSGLDSGQGTSTWIIYANDTFGNTNFDSVTFTVDSIAPNITINSPSSGSVLRDFTPIVNITVDELSSRIWYNINDGSNVTICNNCNGTHTFIPVHNESNFTINVFANDTLSNLATNLTSYNVFLNYSHLDVFSDNASLRVFNGDFTVENNNLTFVGVPGTGTINVGLICASATCSSATSDEPLHNYIAALGHTITNLSESDQSWTDGTYDVVVVSETVNSGNTAWLKTRATPVVTTEGANWDEFDLGTGGGSNTATSNDINITDNSHYITSIFPLGDLTISTGNDGGSMTGWSQGVNDLAIDATTSTIGRLLYAENGATLVDLSTAAERRAFFAAFDANDFNANGITLFQRMVNWAGYNTQGVTTANITSHAINVTTNVTYFTNVTWDESGTSNFYNNLTVQLSADNGTNWYTATNGQGLDVARGTSIVYRVLFETNETINISIDNLNFNWSTQDEPNLTIIEPINNTDISLAGGGNVTFRWNVTDTDSPIHCDFYFGGVLNRSFNCSTNMTNNMSLELPEGSYNWSVSVNDSHGNYLSSGDYFFTISTAWNIELEKYIRNIGNNMYLITLNLTNPDNSSKDIIVTDFVDQRFTYGSFSPMFDFVNLTYGPDYDGTLIMWNLTVPNTTTIMLNYSVTGNADYDVLRNFAVGVD